MIILTSRPGWTHCQEVLVSFFTFISCIYGTVCPINCMFALF